MKIKKKKVLMQEFYDKEDDILNFYWGTKKGVEHSRELDVNLIMDFDKKDDIVGIEIFDFSEALKESQKKLDKIFKLSREKKKNKNDKRRA